ncbi:hypothetical protein [Tritonibacter multivorans]|nr:hypothetical protein [Tritonibacter multivorans]
MPIAAGCKADGTFEAVIFPTCGAQIEEMHKDPLAQIPQAGSLGA